MRIESPGMWRAKRVCSRLSLSILMRQSDFFFVVSSGTVSPKATSTQPPRKSAWSIFIESPLMSMLWLIRWSRSRLPRIRRSPIKLVVLAFSLLNVSSSTSTLPSNNGISCTFTTSRCTSATVSVWWAIVSLGRVSSTLSICKSNGKLRLTCLSLACIPVVSVRCATAFFIAQFWMGGI